MYRACPASSLHYTIMKEYVGLTLTRSFSPEVSKYFLFVHNRA